MLPLAMLTVSGEVHSFCLEFRSVLSDMGSKNLLVVTSKKTPNQ